MVKVFKNRMPLNFGKSVEFCEVPRVSEIIDKIPRNTFF